VTPELTYLAYSILLLFVIVMVHASTGIRQNGGIVMAGPRDNLPAPTTFGARAKRLAENAKENTLIFGALVLIAAVANISNQWTILGAQLFFFARLAHAITYLAGWPLVRPLFWLAGVIACGLIFLAVLGILN
jgi:uncharacterized MAPEG superfamily protein